MSMLTASSFYFDRAGVFRPELIALAAWLCSADYNEEARGKILDHVAGGGGLEDLARPEPGTEYVWLDPHDLAAAAEALAAGRPAPIRGGSPALALAEAEPVAPCVPQTLREAIDHEARSYRSWRTPVGDFLAEQLDRLGQLAAFLDARTPAEFTDRLEVEEVDRLAREYDRGFDDGRRDCYCPR